MSTETANNGETPADRAVVNEKAPERKLPLGVKQTDAIFILVVGSLTFVMLGRGLPTFLSLFFGLVGGAAGGVLVYIKPDNMNIITAGRIALEYELAPDIIYNAGTNAKVKNEGGLRNMTPFKPQERAQDLTNIRLAFPEEGAILSADGRMERLIEIEGSNMDFSDAGVWAKRQDVGQEFANRHVKDRVKLHITTRDFDFDAIADRLQQRFDDNDIKNAPTANAVLEEYYEKRPKEMEERGTQEAKSYLMLSVSGDDVSSGYGDEQTPAEKLSTVPGVGLLLDIIFDIKNTTNQNDISERKKMIDELNQLTKKAKDDLISETPGYSHREVSTVESMVLYSNFFNDRNVNPEDVEQSLGTEQRGVDDIA